VTRRSAPLSATAVPFRPNEQLLAAVPDVVHERVFPFRVPLPVPFTATPLQVAVYAIVAVVAPLGVIVQFMDVQDPLVDVDRHDPLNMLIVGAGVTGVSGVDDRSHAAHIITIVVARADKSTRSIDGPPALDNSQRLVEARARLSFVEG
jgi:hypothetical protein